MNIVVDRSPDRLIDLENDKLETVGEIYFKRTGKRLNPQQLWRWRIKGVSGIRLEAVKLSGAWYTTSRAFANFIERQTQVATNASAAVIGADKRDAVTERRLQAAGLLDHD
jgi:hypothetical protein